MTTLTFVSIFAVLACLLSKYNYGYALAAGGTTVAGAAIVIGQVAIPTFYLVALGLVPILFFRLLGNRSPHLEPVVNGSRLPVGFPLLLSFFFYSLFVTVVAPFLFDGLEVQVTGPDEPLTAGTVTSSNIAQSVYLLLAVLIVFFFGRSERLSPGVLGLAVGGAVLLSFWKYVGEALGVPFPYGFFDNSPFYSYIQTEVGGAERFRGIASEPSGLASSALVATAYMLSRAVQMSGWRRFGSLLVAGIASFLGVVSTSATFIVAAAVLAAVAVCTSLAGFFLRRARLGAVAAILLASAIITAVWFLPVAVEYVATTVNGKVASNSFEQRSSLDGRSYELFFQSRGLGVGLGGNRGSSFFASLLSTTGIIGTTLFCCFVAVLIWKTYSHARWRPVVWALLSILLLKIVAGPDLSDGSGVLWMSLGLLTHAATCGRVAALSLADREPIIQSTAPEDRNLLREDA